MQTKNFFYFMLLLMELSLPLIALIILWFQNKTFSSVFLIKTPLWQQIIIGMLAGIILGFFSGNLVKNIKFFNIIKEIISELIKKMQINIFDIFLIAILAGICEEILFRGVLQQMWGIILSSFIFILLHGYFNPFNFNLNVFGFIMFLLSMLIGLVYETFGIFAAMLFHGSFDFVVLYIFYKNKDFSQFSRFSNTFL